MLIRRRDLEGIARGEITLAFRRWKRPTVRAAELAEAAGFETRWLKVRVRSLKELGLTESLKTGYRLSPRGRAFVRGRRSGS